MIFVLFYFKSLYTTCYLLTFTMPSDNRNPKRTVQDESDEEIVSTILEIN